MVDAGHFGDMVYVVDEHGKRRARNAVGELALEFAYFGFRGFLAFGLVFGFEFRDGFVDFWLLGLGGAAIGLGDKAGIEVDVDDAAFGVGTAGVGATATASADRIVSGET